MNYFIRLALWIVLLCLAPIRYLWASFVVLSGGERGWQCLIAEDESWNVPWGGKASMTISARAEYARQRGAKWGCWLCKLLDYIQPNHCKNAIESL
jgi:hypothetical protein